MSPFIHHESSFDKIARREITLTLSHGWLWALSYQSGWVRGALISPMSDERGFINLSSSWAWALSYQSGWVRGALISPMSDEREFINLSLSWAWALSYQSGWVRGALISPMSDERETGICTSEELPLPWTDRDISLPLANAHHCEFITPLKLKPR